MSTKKIEFSKKPNVQNKSQFIDDWVKGNTVIEKDECKSKRTTIYLPDEFHKKIKVEAAKRGLSISEMVIESLSDYYKIT